MVTIPSDLMLGSITTDQVVELCYVHCTTLFVTIRGSAFAKRQQSQALLVSGAQQKIATSELRT